MDKPPQEKLAQLSILYDNDYIYFVRNINGKCAVFRAMKKAKRLKLEKEIKLNREKKSLGMEE